MGLDTIFNNIDAGNASSASADKAALAAGTLNADFGAAEESGIYFIPEGDERLNDKLNYNLAFIMEIAGRKDANYKVINTHSTLEVDDFVFVDTSDRITQVDKITSVTVAQNYTYTVTLNSSTANYISGTKQVDKLNSFTAVNETLYSATLEGVNADYTSGGNVETRELNSFTQVDDDIYEISIDDISLSYTSIAGDDITDIINDLTSQINASDAAVTASAEADKITIVGDVSGNAFSLSVISGQMSATLITAATSATISQIVSGLKDAMVALGKPVSIINDSSSITITANVRGTSFSLSAGSNFTWSNIVPNHADTKDEVIAGIKSQVDTLGKPVNLTSDANTITFTSSNAGDAFTLSTGSNLSNSNTTPNFDGTCTITFPANPNDFAEVGIFDYTNTFGSKGPILKSVNNIMGSGADYHLTAANKATRFISINNDWRIL